MSIGKNGGHDDLAPFPAFPIALPISLKMFEAKKMSFFDYVLPSIYHARQEDLRGLRHHLGPPFFSSTSKNIHPDQTS